MANEYAEETKNAEEEVGNKDPYFFINGYDFKIGTNAQSKSEINLVKNKMYVAGKRWGYNDIQWTNFTGEELTVELYSRNTDKYTGEKAQPENGGLDNFYNTDRTPHAVLKYWAQSFVKCNIETNIPSLESGTYVIDEFSQTTPHANFVVTKLTLLQYEVGQQIEQTYWQPGTLKNSTDLTAQTKEIRKMSTHTQGCACTSKTDSEDCTASYNEEVELIQKYLQMWGYFPTYAYGIGKIKANGKYCYNTTQAIKKFQEDRGITVTGNFDSTTKNEFIKKLDTIS